MASDRETVVKLVVAGSVAATAVIYLLFVPRAVATGDGGRALAYVAAGWVPYTIAFYALGRLFASPETLPNMRLADVGLAVFLLSLFLSLGIDRWGFTPERVPEAHLLQAVGIYVGLALLGWGLGRRSAAIERVTGES